MSEFHNWLKCKLQNMQVPHQPVLMLEFRSNGYSAKVPPRTSLTLEQIFNGVKDQLHLDNPMSEYCIYNGKAIDFTGDSITTIVSQHSPPVWTIAKKADVEIIEKFCQNVYPSLRHEIINLPYLGFVLLSKMQLAFRLISAVYNDESGSIFELLPLEKFEGLEDVELIKAVVEWFGTKFTYIEEPLKCHVCNGQTERIVEGLPTARERALGAYQVDRYRCKDSKCAAVTRFPRLTDVDALIKRGGGQSPELCVLLASAFNSLGIDVRVCFETSADRFWLEALAGERFVHVDPAGGLVDCPLVYEHNGMKMHHVVAVGLYEASDVTVKYVGDIDAVLESRARELPEAKFQQLVSLRNETLSAAADPETASSVAERQMLDVPEEHEPRGAELEPIPHPE